MHDQIKKTGIFIWNSLGISKTIFRSTLSSTSADLRFRGNSSARIATLGAALQFDTDQLFCRTAQELGAVLRQFPGLGISSICARSSCRSRRGHHLSCRSTANARRKGSPRWELVQDVNKCDLENGPSLNVRLGRADPKCILLRDPDAVWFGTALPDTRTSETTIIFESHDGVAEAVARTAEKLRNWSACTASVNPQEDKSWYPRIAEPVSPRSNRNAESAVGSAHVSGRARGGWPSLPRHQSTASRFFGCRTLRFLKGADVDVLFVPVLNPHRPSFFDRSPRFPKWEHSQQITYHRRPCVHFFP